MIEQEAAEEAELGKDLVFGSWFFSVSSVPSCSKGLEV
jgi:hypothetical protein